MTERMDRLSPDEVTRIAMASVALSSEEVVRWWNEDNPQRLIGKAEVKSCRGHRRDRLAYWRRAPEELLAFLEEENLLPEMCPVNRLILLRSLVQLAKEGVSTTSGPKGDTLQIKPDVASAVRALDLIAKELAQLTPQSTPEPIQITHKGRTLEAVS